MGFALARKESDELSKVESKYIWLTSLRQISLQDPLNVLSTTYVVDYLEPNGQRDHSIV